MKTLKVCTSETNYRDLYFSRLCPACLDGCERGLDGKWAFKKKKSDRMENGMKAGSGQPSPKEIKALTDNVGKRVREETAKEFQEKLDKMAADALALQEHIDFLKKKIFNLQESLSDTEHMVAALNGDVAEAKDKYAICKREVFVLRTAVQDSYRAIEENALQQAVDRQSKWRERGTQIACSVCAIRYEKEEHGHDGDLTLQVEDTDRILFPRATRYLKRVKEVEGLTKKKNKFAFAYEPFTGDNEEPPTTIARHRTTNSSPKKGKKRTKGVETEFGELAIGHPPPTQSSKFSQMKNIPASSKGSTLIGADAPMTKVQVSKVASFLQNDNKIAKFKKLQQNNLLNLTTAETTHLFKLLGSASKNNLENKKKVKKSQRPISAPSHNR